MRRFFHQLSLLILLTLVGSQVSAAGIILIDSARAESESKVIARLRSEALALQKKRGIKGESLNAEFAEALDLSLSDWRSALPEVSASLAAQLKADIAIEPSVATLHKLQGIDRTSDVVKALDARFGKLVLLAP